MVCAFVSMFTGAIVPANVAMTGEITLRGYVTPIGGVKVRILVENGGINLPRLSFPIGEGTWRTSRHNLQGHSSAKKCP